MIRLSKAVRYSSGRINSKEITLDNYVTTENLLQNKLGKKNIEKLPSINGSVNSFDTGHILISNIRPYLKKIWYSDIKGGNSPDVLNLKINQNFNSKFIYYALCRDDFFIHMMKGSKGTKMPRGDKDHVLDFLIPDFKITKQNKIEKILSNLDSKIDINYQINREIEFLIKLIYDYWFIQFEFPDSNNKPYKSSGGEMIYCNEFKREIPKGWEIDSFGNNFSVKKGDLITNEATLSGKIKVVAAGIDYSYYHSESNYPENTITISSSGANAGYINFWREPIFASDCVTVRGSSDTKTLLALYYLKTIQSYIFKKSSGSAQPHVYPEDISDLIYLKIPEKLSKKFGNKILNLNKKIHNNTLEIKKISEHRDWLLPLLMNDQISII